MLSLEWKLCNGLLYSAVLICKVGYDLQINVGAVSPSELRAVSEKSLLLLAGIVADMEVGWLPHIMFFDSHRLQGFIFEHVIPF